MDVHVGVVQVLQLVELSVTSKCVINDKDSPKDANQALGGLLCSCYACRFSGNISMCIAPR